MVNNLIFLDKLYEHFINYINKNIEEVYHYTSLEVMSKILANSSLRFTNINYMNDECEFTYFYLLLEDFINNNKSKYSKNFCKKLEKIYAEHCASPFYFVGPTIQHDNNRQYYISSFSLSDDNLALWTLYTKEQSFMGCNFGIKPNQVSIYTNDNPLIYGKVLYDREEQENILNEIITTLFYVFETNTNFPEDIKTMFGRYALFFKHPAFKQEQEYRFIYYPIDKFNIQNAENKPFIDLPFNTRNDISSVRLSPTMRKNTDLQNIKKLFKQNKMSTKVFNVSDIPFCNSYNTLNYDTYNVFANADIVQEPFILQDSNNSLL